MVYPTNITNPSSRSITLLIYINLLSKEKLFLFCTVLLRGLLPKSAYTRYGMNQWSHSVFLWYTQKTLLLKTNIKVRLYIRHNDVFHTALIKCSCLSVKTSQENRQKHWISFKFTTIISIWIRMNICLDLAIRHVIYVQWFQIKRSYILLYNNEY